MAQLESSSRPSFQITLESLCFLSIEKREIVDQSPWAILVGVNRITAVVFREAALKVGGDAHVVAVWIFYTSQDIHVKHTDLVIGGNQEKLLGSYIFLLVRPLSCPPHSPASYRSRGS